MEYSSNIPPEISQILKRKSSRDPASRFTRKLHLLLEHVTQTPERESEVGLAWISETSFRMNKRILSQVMGIKINTLNVNLRDLHFTQTQTDKNGWTLWTKPGFSRTCYTPDQSEVAQAKEKTPKSKPTKQKQISVSNLLNVGKLFQDQDILFRESVHLSWISITGIQEITPIMSNIFFERAGNYLKEEEQPLENAVEVLKAIITPNNSPTVRYEDFFKFLAMFGPKETAMQKIASLLTYSNNHGNWLSLELLFLLFLTMSSAETFLKMNQTV